eukprot:TRINITY_DN4061_c0_g2_i2.p1 TRINITY_DN4061_c0_g2~~TRINITY_DN4061_c0_g2_i2.p1  ORF type:complete len:154 (+),score=38.69 TRINITY_DN4061_c0_g2_i2:172-633(+)
MKAVYVLCFLIVVAFAFSANARRVRRVVDDGKQEKLDSTGGIKGYPTPEAPLEDIPCKTTMDCLNLEDACTFAKCVSGVCRTQKDSCDDEDICTLDTCDAEKGCSHTRIHGCDKTKKDNENEGGNQQQQTPDYNNNLNINNNNDCTIPIWLHN